MILDILKDTSYITPQLKQKLGSRIRNRAFGQNVLNSKLVIVSYCLPLFKENNECIFLFCFGNKLLA